MKLFIVLIAMIIVYHVFIYILIEKDEYSLPYSIILVVSIILLIQWI
jgi:hypothetical protein